MPVWCYRAVYDKSTILWKYMHLTIDSIVGSSKSATGTPVDTSAEACSVTSNQSVPTVISPIPNVNMPGSSGQSSTQLNCGDISWIDKFQIPWSKCSESLHAAMQRSEPPSGRDLCQLISHTVIDIFRFTRRATRDNLRTIARLIVSHNPKSYADYINGSLYQFQVIMYACRICQFSTCSPYAYMRHYRIHSNAPNFSCGVGSVLELFTNFLHFTAICLEIINC